MTNVTTISFFCNVCGDLRDASHVEFRPDGLIRFFCGECKHSTEVKSEIQFRQEEKH